MKCADYYIRHKNSKRIFITLRFEYKIFILRLYRTEQIGKKVYKEAVS